MTSSAQSGGATLGGGQSPMTVTYDLVVVGAGIHGAGIAQAASARGWSVLVVDKGDIAGGTSSKSSKLIHGGLRYLETMQLRLVYECLRERRLLLRNAPDLVQLKPFYIPVYRNSRRSPLWIRLGLSLYAVLGGLGQYARFARVPRGEWSRLNGLNTQDLLCVYRYYDAQTDDAALTRAVLSSAQTLGAQVVCHHGVTRVWRDQDFYHVTLEGRAEPVRCRALVNAAGPWVNQLAQRVEPPVPQLPVDLVQGTHVVLDVPAPDGCFYLESKDDGRAVFVLPWYGKVMVGTTETLCAEVAEQVVPLENEIAYLLRVFSRYFPSYAVSQKDIIQTMAGVRVLPKATGLAEGANKRSRETQFVVEGEQPRYVAVYGGKLTSYRATSEKVAQKLEQVLPKKAVSVRTEELTLA
jgi:glycerol-3-phosphate dehydrogenase